MRGQPVLKGMSHAGKGTFNQSDQEDEITKTTKMHVDSKCDNSHLYLSVPFIPGGHRKTSVKQLAIFHNQRNRRNI